MLRLFKLVDNYYICYNILLNKNLIDYYKLYMLLGTSLESIDMTNKIEIGPIPNFTSNISTNISNIISKSNINFIEKIEVSYIYDKSNYIFDKMTQIIYNNPIDLSVKLEKNKELDIDVIELINNDKYGLSLEEEDKM